MQHCLLHTLNNLFQRDAFTVAKLNHIAKGLAPGTLPLPLLHPHRTIILGNWDVTVLEIAIEQQGKTLKWHDERDIEFSAPEFQTCFGVVVNLKTPGPIANIFGSRHWFALRKFNGKWYNLDSKLREPELLSDTISEEGENDEDVLLRMFLAKLQKEGDAKVLLIL